MASSPVPSACAISTPKPTPSSCRPGPTRCPGRSSRRWRPGCPWSPRASGRSRSWSATAGLTVEPGTPRSSRRRSPGSPTPSCARAARASGARAGPRALRRRGADPAPGRDPARRRRVRRARAGTGCGDGPSSRSAPAPPAAALLAPYVSLHSRRRVRAARRRAARDRDRASPPSSSSGRRIEYGEAGYDARAAAFSLAVRDPAALVLPDGLREHAISSLVEPMLSAPAASLAYAITGDDPGGLAPCAGLIRGR